LLDQPCEDARCVETARVGEEDAALCGCRHD
jgi:hypothetical protein